MAMSGQNFSFPCSPTTQKLALHVNKSHTRCTNVQTMGGSLSGTDFGYYIISTCACHFHSSISMISCDLHQIQALSGFKFLKGFPLVVMITSFPGNKNIKLESRGTLIVIIFLCYCNWEGNGKKMLKDVCNIYYTRSCVWRLVQYIHS